MKIEIKNRYTGVILYELDKEDNTIKEIPFDMFKHASVRNCACNLGAELRRVYHVNVDRVGKVYIVTREK